MRQFDTETTICAVASGRSSSQRGIIRISGTDSLDVCRPWASQMEFTHLSEMKSATRTNVNLLIDQFQQTIPASLFIWPDNRSYTGQPSVEIHTVGNPLLLELLVEQLISSGAKSAQPGEFTYRAFLNGRLDLTQCEAVLAVINSTHEKALDISLRQLAGGLSAPLSILRSDLINLLADLEAGLDFVEEDIEFVSTEDIRTRLNYALEILDGVLSQLGTRRTANHAPKVVLAGLPNAGKSSLINAVIGNDVAIVSQQAGTTRDFVRSTFFSDAGPIELIDTAGLEFETNDQNDLSQAEVSHALGSAKSIQTKAQDSTLAACTDADLILFCCDGNSNESQLQLDWLRKWRLGEPADTQVWLILTKSDLNPTLTMNGDSIFASCFSVSSINGEGITALKQSLQNWAASTLQPSAEVVPMTLVRCAESVMHARSAISEALHVSGSAVRNSGDQSNGESRVSNLSFHGQEELIAAELRIALHELGAVVGEVYTDDVLDALFSRFCIGK